MALDKNKIIAEATKLVQKGAYDKAITTYEKILKEDAKDVRVLLKVGELYQKKGDDRMAAGAFKRVAETYADQGFFLKSVAVYKQVVKLDAEDVRVNERLAALYQQLGLLSEAMGQFQVIASFYEKAGDGARLLDALKRMVELDPENIGAVVRLGKLYQGANQPGPALDHYRRAASYLKLHNRAEDYLKVAERIVELSPGDLALTRELAHVYMAKGDTKRALAKLQVSFKADGRDVETLTLLAQAFRDLGQNAKTVQVFKTLADVHDRAGRREESLAAWRKVAELAPGDADAAHLLATPRPGVAAPTPPPRPTAGPPPMPSPAMPLGTPVTKVAILPPLQAFGPPRSPPPAPAPAAPLGPEGIPKLLTEVDVYMKYGLTDKALGHLRSILALDAEAPAALEKLRDLHLAAGRRAEGLDAAEKAVRGAIAKGDGDRARESLGRLRQLDPGHPSLGELASACGTTEEITLGGGEVEEELDPGELPATPAELELVDEPPRALDDDALAELAASAPSDEVVDDDPAAPAPPPAVIEPPPAAAPLQASPPPQALAPEALESEREPEGPDAELLRTALASMDSEEVVPETGGDELPELGAEPAEPPPAPAAAVIATADLSDELEEADFFAQQGLLADAHEALQLLRTRHPDHPAVEGRLAEIERRLAARAAAGSAPGSAPTTASPQPTRQSASQLDPSAAEGANIDLGADLAEVLDGAPDLGGNDEEFQYSVEDVFNQFKRGVAETVTAEDSDTHYDLGIAYREMGLVEDAVNEFQTALRGNNRKKEIDSLSMIAHCRLSQGRPGEAIEPLRRALRSDYLTKESAKAIHYELGLAHQALEEPEQALWCFQKVARVDPGYRDTTGRVAALGGGPGRAPAGMAVVGRQVAGPVRPATTPATPAAPQPGPQAAAAKLPGSPPGPKKNIGFL